MVTLIICNILSFLTTIKIDCQPQPIPFTLNVNIEAVDSANPYLIIESNGKRAYYHYPDIDFLKPTFTKSLIDHSYITTTSFRSQNGRLAQAVNEIFVKSNGHSFIHFNEKEVFFLSSSKKICSITFEDFEVRDDEIVTNRFLKEIEFNKHFLPRHLIEYLKKGWKFNSSKSSSNFVLHNEDSLRFISNKLIETIIVSGGIRKVEAENELLYVLANNGTLKIYDFLNQNIFELDNYPSKEVEGFQIHNGILVMYGDEGVFTAFLEDNPLLSITSNKREIESRSLNHEYFSGLDTLFDLTILDTASFNSLLYMATQEGLYSYQKKKNQLRKEPYNGLYTAIAKIDNLLILGSEDQHIEIVGDGVDHRVRISFTPLFISKWKENLVLIGGHPGLAILDLSDFTLALIAKGEIFKSLSSVDNLTFIKGSLNDYLFNPYFDFQKVPSLYLENEKISKYKKLILPHDLDSLKVSILPNSQEGKLLVKINGRVISTLNGKIAKDEFAYGRNDLEFIVINSYGFERSYNLTILVSPPWYLSMMALFVYTITILTLIWSIVRFISNKIENQKVIKSSEHIEYRKSLQQQLAFDFHDEMGNRIARLVSVTNLILIDKSNIDEKLRLLNVISRELFKDARTFVWSLNPENTTILGLYTQLKEIGEEILSRNFKFVISKEVHQVDLEIDSYQLRQLLLLYKEILTNCLKHSKASKVNVHFFQNAEIVMVMIHDDGIGFTFGKLRKKSSGLKSLRTRADKINFKIYFSNYQGAKVIMKGPVNRKESQNEKKV